MSDNLDHYLNLLPRELPAVTINLSGEEAATVLKAYDDGIRALSDRQLECLDGVIAKLKDEIWP